MRPLVLAAVLVLLVASVGAAGPVLAPPQPETLVEGHVVFTVVELASPMGNNTTEARDEFAAAVAVLVREYREELRYSASFARFAGVLWFNDQYLVDPENAADFGPRSYAFRYPCTGAVLAVNEGDPVPRDVNGTPNVGSSAYVESYLVTDVHDRTWNIDRWTMPSGRPLWSVAILDGQDGYDEPDDRACSGGVYRDVSCVPYVPGVRCVDADPSLMVEGLPSEPAKDPGDHGYHYPCGEPDNRCRALAYNALLFFRLKDLTLAGAAKNHTDGSPDRQDDVAGCHEPGQPALDEWPCPDDDDDREGNSHPYNPELPWPAQQYDGRGNHGGSADCGGADGANDSECHATRRIDVYFGYASRPPARDYWLVDTVGRSAPYHCHDDSVACGPEYSAP